jgi:hypothetical protein
MSELKSNPSFAAFVAESFAGLGAVTTRPMFGGNNPMFGGNNPMFGGNNPILGGHKVVARAKKSVRGGRLRVRYEHEAP